MQTDASAVHIVHNHYISAIAYEVAQKSLVNTNAYRLDNDGESSSSSSSHH